MLEVREMREERQCSNGHAPPRRVARSGSSTMKLTPELLTQASSSLNPIKERQLDLRGKSYPMSVFSSTVMYTGYKIPAIENLGVTKVGD